MNSLGGHPKLIRISILDEAATSGGDSFSNSITKIAKDKRLEGDVLKFEDVILEGISNDSDEFKKIVQEQLSQSIDSDVTKKSILIIEDDVDACENLHEVLSEKYKIFIANTAKEGTVLLEKKF